MSDEFDEYFNETENDENNDDVIDQLATNNPNAIRILSTTGGQFVFVPTSPDPVTVREVMTGAGLALSLGAEIFLDNDAPLNINDVVPFGSTLTVIGQVKGGGGRVG